jgi:hypothetical protein
MNSRFLFWVLAWSASVSPTQGAEDLSIDRGTDCVNPLREAATPVSFREGLKSDLNFKMIGKDEKTYQVITTTTSAGFSISIAESGDVVGLAFLRATDDGNWMKLQNMEFREKYREQGVAKAILAKTFNRAPVGASFLIVNNEKRTSDTLRSLKEGFSAEVKNARKAFLQAKDYDSSQELLDRELTQQVNQLLQKGRHLAPYWCDVLYNVGWRNIRISGGNRIHAEKLELISKPTS